MQHDTERNLKFGHLSWKCRNTSNIIETNKAPVSLNAITEPIVQESPPLAKQNLAAANK